MSLRKLKVQRLWLGSDSSGYAKEVTATATELNKLDGVSTTTAEFNLINGVTATTAELNKMDGVLASTAEINAAADVSAQDLMAGSTAMEAAMDAYTSSVVTQGGIIKTEILIDYDGSASTTTENDIIGATGACHIGQVTAAINGAIQYGVITCFEVPTGGVTDIDLSQASIATGAYDADVTGLTGYAAVIQPGAAWTLGLAKPFAGITANYYLYLSSGAAGTAAEYTAGKFLIELWGV